MKPLFCIMGRSGSGKSTIVKETCRQLHTKQIPSYTTRQPRIKNEQGHTFVTQEEFDNLRDNLVAYAKTTGAEYGVTADMIDNEDYLFYIVDVTGFKELKEKYKGGRKLIPVEIFASDEEIYCRLIRRYARIYKDFDKALTKTKDRIQHDEIEFDNLDDIAKMRVSTSGNMLYSTEDFIGQIIEFMIKR